MRWSRAAVPGEARGSLSETSRRRVDDRGCASNDRRTGANQDSDGGEGSHHLSDQEVNRRSLVGAQMVLEPRRSCCVSHGGPHASAQLGQAMNTRRGKRAKSRVRRRNPVARTLRDPAFRARREASRRRYSRKLRHKQERESDDA